MPVLPIAPRRVDISAPLRVPAANTDLPPNYDDVVGSSLSSSSASSLSSSPSTSGVSSRSVSPPRLGPRIEQLNNRAPRLPPSGTIYPERPHGPLSKNDARPRHFAATGTLPDATMQELNRKLAHFATEDARMEAELRVAEQTLQSRRECHAADRGNPSAPTFFAISGGLHTDEEPVPETALKVRRAEKELAKLQKEKDALLKQRDQLLNTHLKRMRKLDGKLQRLAPSPGVSGSSSRH